MKALQRQLLVRFCCVKQCKYTTGLHRVTFSHIGRVKMLIQWVQQHMLTDSFTVDDICHWMFDTPKYAIECVIYSVWIYSSLSQLFKSIVTKVYCHCYILTSVLGWCSLLQKRKYVRTHARKKGPFRWMEPPYCHCVIFDMYICMYTCRSVIHISKYKVNGS